MQPHAAHRVHDLKIIRIVAEQAVPDVLCRTQRAARAPHPRAGFAALEQTIGARQAEQVRAIGRGLRDSAVDLRRRLAECFEGFEKKAAAERIE